MDLDEEELKATRKLNGASKEIEVGEYVRTDEGLILIYNKDNDKVFINNFAGDKINITKHSKNIIDLIEVGDIIEVQTGLYNKYKIIIEDEDTLISTQESLKNWAIKSIITKEQYNANSFRLEE